MARLRHIKPGFFKNELLAEVPPVGRLLFAGMWGIADREGRLEDRPKRIKAEVMPYDDFDADAMVAQLASLGFLLRYEVDGARYLQIVNWDKHQQPHMHEAESTIQAPYMHGASTVLTPDKHDSSTGHARLELELGTRTKDVEIDDSKERGVQGGGDAPVSEPQKLPTAADHVDNFTPFADYVWDNWPARNGKKLYKKKAIAALNRIPSRDWDAVAWGVDNFAESSQAIRGFAPNLHTWLKDEAWKDWLEPEQPTKGNGAPPALDPKKYTEGKYAGIFNPKAKAKGEGDAAPY